MSKDKRAAAVAAWRAANIAKGLTATGKPRKYERNPSPLTPEERTERNRIRRKAIREENKAKGLTWDGRPKEST